jgi:beta-xylosidase
MGLLREDGSPKPAAEIFPRYAPALGLVQWFHFQDHRLDAAVATMKAMGVTTLRTGLSWADTSAPAARNGSTARWRRCATSTSP